MTSNQRARNKIYEIARAYLSPERAGNLSELLPQLARDLDYGEGEDAVAELIYRPFSLII